MKKSAKIILSMLFASLLLMSCGNGQNPSNDTSAQTAKQTDPVQTVTQTVEITETNPVTTEPETDEPATTAPETDEPDNAFDIEKEDAIPYKLLTMTFDEIEKEYGTLIYQHGRHGGTPVYQANNLPNISIDFMNASATYTEDVPIETSEEKLGNLIVGMAIAASDDIPTEVYIGETDNYVYPGLKVGMSVENINSITPDWNHIYYLIHRDPFLHIEFSVEDYNVSVAIEIPEGLVNEVFKSQDDYNDDVLNERQDEITQKFSENPQGTVVSIIVSR